MRSRWLAMLIGGVAAVTSLGVVTSTTRGFAPIAPAVAYTTFAFAFAAVVAKGGPGFRRASILFAATLLIDALGATLGRTPNAMSVTALAAVWMLAGWTTAAFWSARDVAGVLALPYWAWATYVLASIAHEWRVR